MRMPPTTATRRTLDPTSILHSVRNRSLGCHACWEFDYLRERMTPTISGWVLLLTSLVYLAGLFAIAWWGDRSKLYPDNARFRPLIYSFALGVYGSSWTFYGAVGTAKQEGVIASIAGYVGPLVLLAFGLPFFERLVRLAKVQNATSIS